MTKLRHPFPWAVLAAVCGILALTMYAAGAAQAATVYRESGHQGYFRGTCTVQAPGSTMLISCAPGQSEYVHWNFRLPVTVHRATCSFDAFACNAAHVYGRLWQARATLRGGTTGYATAVDVVFMLPR